MIEVNNSYNSQYFFYWKIQNGFIGFVTIGGNDPSACYNYAVYSYIIFEDISCINCSEPEVMTIDFAPDEYYSNPGEFETYLFEDLTYGEDIIFIPDTTVTDFKFFLLDFDEWINGNRVVSEVLYTNECLTHDKPFVTRIYIAGVAGPYYGISFSDKTGKTYNFVIYESGDDGRYFLAPLYE